MYQRVVILMIRLPSFIATGVIEFMGVSNLPATLQNVLADVPTSTYSCIGSNSWLVGASYMTVDVIPLKSLVSVKVMETLLISGVCMLLRIILCLSKLYRSSARTCVYIYIYILESVCSLLPLLFCYCSRFPLLILSICMLHIHSLCVRPWCALLGLSVMAFIAKTLMNVF